MSEKSISQADSVLFWDMSRNFDIKMSKNLFFSGSPLHYHPIVEIFFWLEGECTYFVDDQSYELQPGDIVFSPAGVLHKTTYNPNIPLSRGLIYCQNSLLPKSIREFCAKGKPYITNLSNTIGSVMDLFHKIQQENEHPDKYSEDMVKSYIAALTVLILRNGKKSDNSLRTGKNRIIELTVSYIKNNYSNRISLDDAAKNAAVSSKYLSLLFKKETGFNFNEYLTLYRMKKSELLLTESPDKSILEIAYDCGFNDSNYFSTRFKKVYGISPSQLRRRPHSDIPKNIISL